MQPSFFQAYARCVVPHPRFTDCIFLSIIFKCGNSRHKELETRIGPVEAQAAANSQGGPERVLIDTAFLGPALDYFGTHFGGCT